MLELSERVFDASTAALVSDAGCAAEFANAALLACAYNVRINHRYMKDAAAIARQSATLTAMEERATKTLARAAPTPRGRVSFLDGSVGRGGHRAKDFSGEMPGVFVRFAFNRADVKGKGNVTSAARGHEAGESLLNEFVVA